MGDRITMRQGCNGGGELFRREVAQVAAKDRRLHAVRTWPSHSKTTWAHPIPPLYRIALPAVSTDIRSSKKVGFLRGHAITSPTVTEGKSSGTASRDIGPADLNILASSLGRSQERGVIYY
jgi:hypothetical protein